MRSLRPLQPTLALCAVLIAAALFDLTACASRGALRVAPVDGQASSLLAEARTLARRDPEALGRIGALLEEGERAAPEWVAPRRWLDDLERDGLGGAERLALRLSELDRNPQDASLLYLVGRLEGAAGVVRFQQAALLDPDLAWPHHGLAWMSFLAGDARGARRHGQRALARARDSWERAFFAQAQSRYLMAERRGDEARQVLEDTLGVEGLEECDRRMLEVRAALLDLLQEETQDRGAQRALDLLRSEGLTGPETRDLATALFAYGSSRGGEIRNALEAAVGWERSADRDRLLADLLLERGAYELALGLLRETDSSRPWSPARRLMEFAAGDWRAAVASWLGDLPGVAIGADGFPKEERLRRLVELARSPEEDEPWRELGSALVTAGWFEEARAWAHAEAVRGHGAALRTDAEATRGLTLLADIDRVLRAVDGGKSYTGPWPGAPAEAKVIDSVDRLLEALVPAFRVFYGPEGGLDALVDSPRTRYGPFAEVVHPGPLFSELDEREGRGPDGDEVPGLARALARLGRFGVFGNVVGGGGPDGTVLRQVAVEQVSGEHLGVPFAGTVAWCDGADVPSRPVRRGARIVGAALHEGYWVDVAGIRDERERWFALQLRFQDPEQRRLRLSGRGPRLAGHPSTWDAERTRLYAPLGAGDRLRLAVLDDRGDAEFAARPLVPLDELVEATAIHEQGHLCDRTRFLPIGKKPLKALGFLAGAGLRRGGLPLALEYRAQLVALVATPDPRLPLAECVDAVDGRSTVTPHGAAYRKLLEDFLIVLAERFEAQGGLHPDRYLLHQLHHLGPEEVRAVARELAERKGLVD